MSAAAVRTAREPRPVPVDHSLPMLRGMLGPLDACRLALELRAAMVATRTAVRRIAAGRTLGDDPATLAWLAVDLLTLAEVTAPADGWRAARLAAEAAAETNGHTARAHVLTP